MSVKVVQGLIGERKSPIAPAAASANQQQTLATTQQAVSAVSQAATQAQVSSEAVSVSLRASGRTSTSGSKIKDYKEAKEVTEKVADQIKTDDSAKDAHSGLSATSGASLV